MGNPKAKARAAHATVHLLLVAVAIVSLFPVIWMMLIALKPVTHSVTGWAALLDPAFTVSNFRRVFQLIPFWQNTMNSVISTLAGTALALFFSSLAGFAFAKFRFPGRELLFYIIIATLFIPLEVGVIPLFVIMRNLGLVNSLWALILPKMVPAIGIFYMRQYIQSAVPDELIEAAKIDGASDFRTFVQIVLPVIKPGLVAWGSITIVARWNDFFWPLIILRSQERFTLMLSIALLPVSEGLSTPWQVIMAGTSLAIIPVMLLYVFVQKYQISGITAGALKG
jgi:ABC-type sugar transport system, permease component